VGPLVLTVPLVAATAGLLLATRGLPAGRRFLAALLPLAFAISLVAATPLSPFAIASGAVGLFAISHALGSDLRERLVDLRLLLGALGIILLLDAVDSATPFAGAFAGALIASGLAGTLWAGGQLYARLRGIGIDPLTGSRAEAFGSGDIPAWALVGALLATPTTTLHAFIASLLVGALASIVVLARRGRTQMRDADGNAPDESFIPLLPAIVAGATLALWVNR
jgi:hypothetical protein